MCLHCLVDAIEIIVLRAVSFAGCSHRITVTIISFCLGPNYICFHRDAYNNSNYFFEEFLGGPVNLSLQVYVAVTEELSSPPNSAKMLLDNKRGGGCKILCYAPSSFSKDHLCRFFARYMVAKRRINTVKRIELPISARINRNELLPYQEEKKVIASGKDSPQERHLTMGSKMNRTNRPIPSARRVHRIICETFFLLVRNKAAAGRKNSKRKL